MAAKIERVTTPTGVFQWVFITGLGKENFNRNGYDYTADLVLEGEDAESFKAQIDAYYKAAFPNSEPKSTGYKEGTGDNEGKTVFTFKTKTTKKDGTERKIVVGDSRGKKMILGERKISNGSTGVIHGAMGTYVNGPESGVSLFLNQVQLLNFIPYEEASMGDLGGGDDAYVEPDMAEMEADEY